MKQYKLSRIQKEYNCKLGELISFLSSNGYNYEENPNTEISEEAKRFIDYNFNSKSKAQNIAKKKDNNTNLPIEIKILEAVNKEKLLIERVIGFTDFQWKYLLSRYNGECTQPIPFNTFDEVICEILLKGEELSLAEIGKIIGLDSENDPAAYEVISKAIRPLTEPNKDGERMVDGDDSAYWLTSLGKNYAEKGYKYSTFNREFEIYWDIIGDEHLYAKESLSDIKSIRNPVEIKVEPHKSIQQLQSIAEVQAPEIHLPKKGFNLINANHISTNGFQAKVWVCFLENFRDNTTRTIVYDETQDKIRNRLSKIIDSRNDIKDELLERLILNDESVSETTEQKTVEQLDLEKQLITQQGRIDEAILKEDLKSIPVLKKEIEEDKTHFNTLEFELELKKLFETTCDDVWIISPWIRKHAFNKRLVFIKDYLQKGGRVFIAYSKEESNDNIESSMVDEESMHKLIEFDKDYNHFYYSELPHFHYKNVWLRDSSGGNIYYNGSFNILSFFVNQNQKYVRQEKMAKHIWNNETEKEHIEVFKIFGVNYINSFIAVLNQMSQNPPTKIDQSFIKKMLALGNEKLKPFEESDIFRDEIVKFKKAKDENALYFRKELFKSEIDKYRGKVSDIPNNKLPRVEKSKLLKEFNSIRSQYEDLLELQMIAFEVQVLIENITVLGRKNFKDNNKIKSRKR
jgi:hypothetical protein